MFIVRFFTVSTSYVQPAQPMCNFLVMY